jgi:hypothetical protein
MNVLRYGLAMLVILTASPAWAAPTDCARGLQLLRMARQQVSAADPAALQTLQRSMELCPVYEAYETYAEAASHSLSRADHEKAAAAFVDAEALAPSPEARAHTLFKYAQLLDQDLEAPAARPLLYTARLLKPGDAEIEALITQVDREVENPTQDDVNRGLRRPIARPLKFRDGVQMAIPPFPWPPPPFSASIVIDRSLLRARVSEVASQAAPAGHAPLHLLDVDAVLQHALRGAGYEYRYYAAPGGFALVARLERITEAGAPYPGDGRWNASFRPIEQFSLVEYLRALFLAQEGHYRVIAFIVSRTQFTATGAPITSGDAAAWLEGGANVLPRQIGAMEYLPDYDCTALIYEFDKDDPKSNPVERAPGRLSAQAHLDRSGIAAGLWQ